MAQPLITSFYNKRKRCAEGFSTKSKVLVIDGINAGSSSEQIETETENIKKVFCDRMKEINDNEVSRSESGHSSSRMKFSSGNKKTRLQKSKAYSQINKSDIRFAFKAKELNTVGSPDFTVNQDLTKGKTALLDSEGKDCDGRVQRTEKKVVFQLLGSLSPQKTVSLFDESSVTNKTQKNEGNASTITNARMELGLKTPKKFEENKQKELSMFEIRNKLATSSRLSEIRQSMKNFKRGEEQLKEIESRKCKLEVSSPQIKKFTSIDLEVPISPQKAGVSSPLKSSVSSPLKSSLSSPFKGSLLKSPLKSPLKAPAHQRYAHLIQPGVPSLVLPYSYRMLGEIFRCTDTVASMFFNRKETITFQKLKAGVQQMLRRNFTEYHLGQIMKVMPSAFHLSVQKIPIIGFLKKNKYELIVSPVVSSEKIEAEISEDISHPEMTPSILVERIKVFHRNLLEIVLDRHEEFLRSLDPPVVVSRSEVSRWHPDFEIEKVPTVEPDTLPQPPSEDKICSAKDVLERAKKLYGCNQRMEKALQFVSAKMKEEEELAALSEKGLKTSTGSATSLLKGVPKALLDKIRAKQAAKALVAMTRTPAEDQEATQLLRLPEIARILRNIFVVEKKSVLALEVVLRKLADSYRASLSSDELDQHIRLLIKVVPGWFQILHVRKADYLKISERFDVSSAMNKLEELAAEKNSVT